MIYLLPNKTLGWQQEQKLHHQALLGRVGAVLLVLDGRARNCWSPAAQRLSVFACRGCCLIQIRWLMRETLSHVGIINLIISVGLPAIKTQTRLTSAHATVTTLRRFSAVMADAYISGWSPAPAESVLLSCWEGFIIKTAVQLRWARGSGLCCRPAQMKMNWL